ncbi:M28 family peptidase [Sphingobacterium sp. SRCM116780]|uniref:M28 family peptidase n=1 Tax=Sphingobacterium sp. SRCM116780 TaxID=2907623 RepID=UPI001F225540|nr:M28 family peptidase [Sphingobacterium sp. SRCM116780]UIR57399.1 M28 family peptidase [Sphingobacterium sp. SRCM116780]
MKNKPFLLILLLLLATSSFAQNKDAIAFAKVINSTNAKEHLTILASDEWRGREAGTVDGQRAAQYIADYYQKIGIKGANNGGYMQEVTAMRIPLSESLQVQKMSFKPVLDFFNIPGSVSLSGFHLEADSILFAGYGIIKEGFESYNDFQNQSVTGKVVMLLGSGSRDETFSFQDKIKYLSFHKAKAVLMVEPVVDNKSDGLLQHLTNSQMLLEGSTELSTVEKMTQSMPLIYIGQRVADVLLKSANTNLVAIRKKLTENNKPYPFVFKTDFSASASRALETVHPANVLGFIPGSDPILKDEVILLSAHYDHLGINHYSVGDSINNGADDNGSGTTGLLLMADAFMQAVKAGKGPKRSILFMATTGEEKGLLGSSWYINHAVISLNKIITNLNVDMIGRTDTLSHSDNNYIYIIGADKLSSDLDRIVKETNATYTKLELDERYNVRNDPFQLYYRSDHYNFAKQGIPVTFYFSGFHSDYHKPSDELSKIDFDLLCKRTQLIFYTAWELANAKTKPTVDKKME